MTLPKKILEKLERTKRKPLHQTKSPSTQVLTLTLTPSPDSLAPYLVNNYARPNGLVPLIKNVPQYEGDETEKPGTRVDAVDAFLARFEMEQLPKPPQKTRRGVNGWKLSMAKPQRAKPGSVTERKQEREPEVKEDPYLKLIGLSHEV